MSPRFQNSATQKSTRRQHSCKPHRSKRAKDGLTIEICGIEFKRAQVDWEDAFKYNKAPGHKVLTALATEKPAGVMPRSLGFVKQIGHYLVICHEWEPATEVGDFTVVPLRPQTETQYV